MPDFNAYPALQVKTFNVLEALGDVQTYKSRQLDYETKQSLLPGRIKAEEEENALRHTAYGDALIAHAAAEAETLGPDQAPAYFDAKMEEIGKTNPIARQYIGQYRPELARNIKSAFGGSEGGGRSGRSGKSGADGEDDAPQKQMMFQQLAKVPPEQRAMELAKGNDLISKYESIHNADDLEAVTNQLKQSDPQIARALAGMDFTKKDKLSFYSNWENVTKLVDKVKKQRDVLQDFETNEALGISNELPANPKVVGNYVIDMNNPRGAPLFAPPEKPDKAALHQFKGVNETGGKPVDYDPVSGKVTPFEGGDNYEETAAKIIATERGPTSDAKNPRSSATGDGQFVEKTWLAQTRKQFPSLKDLPDKTLLEMRKLPNFSTDMSVAQVKEDAAALKAAGQPVTTASTAVAYKLGMPDALKVLKAKPETPLNKILSKSVMDANKDDRLFQNNPTAETYLFGMAKKFGNAPVGAQSLFGDDDESLLAEADPKAKGITNATGLPVPAFMMLTGDGAKLPRDKASRGNAIKAMGEFLKKRDLDQATFQSQYKAQNEVLQKNIHRYDNTINMEDEIIGTAENMAPIMKAIGTNPVRIANMGLMLAGKEFNDPYVARYRLHFTQLRNELAGYMHALSGDKKPDITDAERAEASEVIIKGMGEGSLNGLVLGVKDSATKMRPVMQRAIDRANKNVWAMFGVGDQYKPKYPEAANGGALFNEPGAGGARRTLSEQDKQAMEWVKANPTDPRAAQIKQRLGM